VRTCPKCGGSVRAEAEVCRHCLNIIDREGWGHDAGRLGADGRGAGREPEDPPVGPIPVSGSGLAGGFGGGIAGAANAGFRLLATGLLLRRRRRDQSDA
jgi:hypothetical protein